MEELSYEKRGVILGGSLGCSSLFLFMFLIRLKILSGGDGPSAGLFLFIPLTIIGAIIGLFIGRWMDRKAQNFCTE